MIKRATYFILLFTGLFLNHLSGQTFESPFSDARDTIIIESNKDTMHVFVFNSDEKTVKNTGSVILHSPLDSASFTFTWQKYDSLTYSFNTFFSQNGIISTALNLQEGTYRIIFNHVNGFSDTVYAGIFINNFWAEVTNKNSENKLNRTSYTCDYFRITSEAPVDVFRYIDFNDSSRHVFESEIEAIQWDSDTEDTDFSGLNQTKLSFFEYNKLAENASIRLLVTDKFGAQGTDTVEYETIQVRAKLEEPEFTYVAEVIDSRYYTNQKQTSAPQLVKFSNKSSSKTDSLHWKFGDSYTSYDDTVIHSYLLPGTYQPVLTVFNTTSGCIDSILPNPITISSYELKMPNVFIINGSSRFRCLDISVTYIDIVIISRYGRKVHEFKGNIHEWQGWDGKIIGSDRYVQPGVYFYFIKTIIGWEENLENKNKTDIPDEIRQGFFQVYHDNI